MKYLAAALALVGAAASAVPPPPNPALPPPDLRRALEQYHRDANPPPRQLTPVERAELRRQLSESRSLPPPAVRPPPRH